MGRRGPAVGSIGRVIRRACTALCAAVAMALPLAGAAQPKATALSLANGALQGGPDTLRFRQGDPVQLEWTSDRPVTLHLHGYDIETKVAPGRPAAMSFKATLPGRFPVEMHGTAQRAHRPVLYIEVYP